MNYLILFLKGLLIGIGKIIPGVSGAHIAMSLHAYEESLNKLPYIKENIFYFLFLCFGIILSIFIFSPLILYLINNYYLFTMCFFIGLLSKTIKLNSESIIVIPCSIIVLLIYLFIRVPPISINNHFTSFFMGMVESFTTLIPGVSGTATYMVLGCYNDILKLYSLNNIGYLITFGLGFISFSIIIVLGISYLLKRKKHKIEIILEIFMVSSLLFMFAKLIPYITSGSILSCVSIFITGYIIASIIE